MLPDGDGVELVDFARNKEINCRFLILSALGDIEERVEGLDLGADDYIVKPFEPEDLLARIRAAIRRPMPELSKTWICGYIELEQQSKNVKISEKSVVLPRRELIVLETLIKSADRVVTRQMLEKAVYGYDDEIMSNSLESHISRLRKKLVSLDSGVIIHAVRGVGYLMKEVQ
jgi:DNA-binding response OmpR family regulator